MQAVELPALIFEHVVGVQYVKINEKKGERDEKTAEHFLEGVPASDRGLSNCASRVPQAHASEARPLICMFVVRGNCTFWCKSLMYFPAFFICFHSFRSSPS